VIIKIFLGVNKYTSRLVIHGDMGWDPPSVDQKKSGYAKVMETFTLYG